MRSPLPLVWASLLGVAAGCAVEESGLLAGGGAGSGGARDAGSAATGGQGGGQSGDVAVARRDGHAVDDVSSMGGATGFGGATGAGGSQGMGGATGRGGASGPDGSAGSDGARDAADVPIGDGEPDAGRDVDRDVARDLAPSQDLAASEPAVDARDGRARRDGPDAAAIDHGPSRTLVWSDEFEGAADTGVDTSKWTYVTWPPGEVNEEKQQYSSSTKNVFQDGQGCLVLRALYAPAAENPYTSGRIETRGQVWFEPGHRIEVRAKLPAGLGSFPAILMLGTSGSWPDCGELALMEQFGQDKSGFYASVSAGSGAGSGSTDKTWYAFADATTSSDDFHVYSLDWYWDHVVFQVDGDEVLTSTYAPSSPLYDIAEYIVLDVALGGDMGGAIDNTAFPMDMVVDYVRVYEL
jgi:beta-glucanase (GH16 family)